MASLRLAVLVSGSGTNFQNIVEQGEQGLLQSKVHLVIADRPCKALERAQNKNIENHCLSRGVDLCTQMHDLLSTRKIDFIVLAGFLSILTEKFCQDWNRKIINVHPSLLPKYGGKNMYGAKVHQAVLDNKEEYSGATVHFVNSVIDGGEIIVQEKVEISQNENITSLQKKVQAIEYDILIKAIQKIENA